jgi:hypothetical protein
MTWDLTNNVNVIPGCGPIKTRTLREVGVCTLHDLLNYTGPAPPGMNLTQMKFLIHKETGQSVPTGMISHPTPVLYTAPHTMNHTWFQLAGHVLHKDGSTSRVEISSLIIAPYGVVLATNWFSKGKWRFRAVTPLMLAVTHVMWTNHEVVSDDSDEEVDQKKSPVPSYLLSSTDMPWFEVSAMEKLNNVQSDQLQLQVREVNLYQQHSLLRMT